MNRKIIMRGLIIAVCLFTHVSVIWGVTYTNVGCISKAEAEEYILAQFDRMPNIKKGNAVFKKLSSIFKKFPLLIETRDKMGWTLLHEAAHAGNLEMAEFLIMKGADCDAQTDGIGDTPLHLAARSHAWDIMILLYYEYEINEKLNDLDEYPFDHDCPLCPLKQFDLRKRILQL